MKTQWILTFVLAAMLIAGCSGAKYAEEKTLLTTVTKAMETFVAAINSADAPADAAAAVNAFTGQMETLVPTMKALTTEHPEWENEPPAELKETMEKFDLASGSFREAMPKLMQMAAQHADDTQLQGALEKFQSVMSGL